MKRAAVIDIGTNSVKLTVAEIDDEVRIVNEDTRLTRLGKGVDESGRLNPDAIKKTLEAVVALNTVARQAGASSVVAAGTSALRDAVNGRDLIDAVKAECGLEIEIISGKREASLAFAAVTGDATVVKNPESSVLVFDIGGGSTELVWGVDGSLKENVSLNIGAVRLTERHFYADPPTDEEYAAASNDGAGAVYSFISGKEPVPQVCGVGGTATTFAALVHSTKDIHGKTVELHDIERCVGRLRSMKLADRKALEYLEPERADIIIAGGAILLGILKDSKALFYTVSVRGMRFGLLLEQRPTFASEK
jgi:exopolyphosphatase/guanosine-5'-triphosphate,3'-diphosphate pyrophosphatase